MDSRHFFCESHDKTKNDCLIAGTFDASEQKMGIRGRKFS